MINISPKIVNTGLVLNLDPSHFKSYGLNDLPVKDACILWLDADDASSFVFSEDSDTVTITNAAPAVFTSSSSHNLNVGDAVQFSTTGALPGGIQTVVTYYVTSIPSTTTFTVGFSRQNSYNLPTNSAGSGTHTVYKLEKVNQWKDKSGNNNHASQASSGSRPSRSGLQNGRKSVIFDGINDSLSTSNSLNLSVTHTIFAIASQTTGTEDAGLVSIDNSLNNGLTLSNGSSYLAYFGDGSKYASYGISASTSYIFTKVFKGTSSTTRQVYLNGTSATTTGVIANSDASGVIRLGQQSTYLNGTIAEVIIFNRELTATELKQIHTYLGQKWGISNTDRSIIDLSGNENNGLLGNGTEAYYPSYRSANYGGLFYDGSDDYVKVGAKTSLQLKTLTFGAFVKTSNPSQSVQFIGGYGDTGAYGYWLGSFGSNLTWLFSVGNGTSNVQMQAANNSVSGEKTYYVVGTYDGYNQRIYVDGILKNSATTVTGPINYTGISNGFILGHTQGLDSGRFFTGAIYSVHVYNRALTAAEINQNYQALLSKFFRDGSTPSRAAESAGALQGLVSTNGVYWLKPPGTSSAFQAYIDFTTDNGPWVHVGSALGNTRGLWSSMATWRSRTTDSGTSTSPYDTSASSFNAGAFIYCKGKDIMIKEDQVGYVVCNNAFFNESWRDVYNFLNNTTDWPTNNIANYTRQIAITTRSGTCSSSVNNLLYGCNFTTFGRENWYVYSFDASGDTRAFLTTTIYTDNYPVNAEADQGIGATEDGTTFAFPGTASDSSGNSFDAGTNGTYPTNWAGKSYSIWIRNV